MLIDVNIQPSKIYKLFVLITNTCLVSFSLYCVVFIMNMMLWQQIFMVVALVLIICAIIIKSKNMPVVEQIVVTQQGVIAVSYREKLCFSPGSCKLKRTNPVVMQSNPLVLPYLMLLRFKVKSQSKVITVLILSDSMPKARFRALSVAMQWIIKN